MATEQHWPSVVVPTPAHSSLADCLTYTSPDVLAPGTLVRVPLGKRDLLGVVWECPTQPPADLACEQTRAVSSVLSGISPLNAEWRELVQFAAQYYQRALGEVALAALPPQLRDLQPDQWQRRLKKAAKPAQAEADLPNEDATADLPSADASALMMACSDELTPDFGLADSRNSVRAAFVAVSAVLRHTPS